MKTRRLLFLLFIAAHPLSAAETGWLIQSSTISYHADHPFHNTIGRSNAAKGKGICGPTGCDFLVAVPVKTFDSGDQNRDLHMVQAVHGGDFPMVSVRAHLNSEPTPPELKADLTVDFGGKQVIYHGVDLEISEKTPDGFHVKGKIPLLLSRHKVDRPSLVGVAIKDSAPVNIDIQWGNGSNLKK